MIFLTGLLGMMAVGSFAFLNISPEEDDEEAEDHRDLLAESKDIEDGAKPENTSMDLPLGDSLLDAPVEASADTTLTSQTSDPALLDADSDFLDGTDSDDLIFGKTEDEHIRGFDGSDTLDGDEGNDTIEGQDGPDDLYGGLGDDSLSGGTGHDTIHGDEGADLLRGGTGDDALHGREDEDTLIGDRGQDTLFGGDGNDVISGIRLDADGEDFDERDYLNGGDGDDTVIAGEDDVVHLGNGADILVLGDWMTDTGAEILDFDEEEDQLMVVYNDQFHGDAPDPEIRMAEGNPSLTEILLGDQVLATLSTEDAPDLNDIVLIAESTLADLGLEAATARHVG